MLSFITGNAGKAKYLADYLHMPVTHKKIRLQEIQSMDLEEIVRDKAERAYAEAGSPVLVEDVSLSFAAMNGLPGPLIKWFLETLGNDGLCGMLQDERKARAEVAFALRDENGTHVFKGSMEGRIAESPRGEQGFGWDPIFIPEGHEKTWAEMSDDEKHATSMRKEALEKMMGFLKGY